MTEEFEQFVNRMQQVVDIARSHAYEYAQASGQCDSRTLERVLDFKISEVDTSGMFFAAEYNDACNCHPEWMTAEVFVPMDAIEKMVNGEDWKTPVQKATLARLAQEEAKKKRDEEARATKAKADLEARERAELERLKTKYGESSR